MVTIQKRCFQVWIGDPAQMPAYYPASAASIQQHLVGTGWTYELVTTETARAFVAENYPAFLETYDGFEHAIQRADAIRPMWLNKHGGLDLDMHFEVLAPLDSMFTGAVEAYFVQSPNISSVLTNAFMASVPNATVWPLYLEQMQKPLPWYIKGKHFTVMASTGPLALTAAVEQSNTVYGALPRGLIVPCSVCELDTCASKGRLLRQLPGGTWHNWDSKVLDVFYCNRWLVLGGCGIFLLLMLLFLWWRVSTRCR